ncbi:MAG TPA: hypothetical protein P5533_04620, partial [Candidatus Cloacimonadota bacterium]|nr:hypothetical protein [Candidatus Cloacimonadota bacterium]
MKILPVKTAKQLHAFFAVPKTVYRGNPSYRATDESVARLVIQGSAAFRVHATVKAYLILKDRKAVARFALIRDRRLPEQLMIAFFEAVQGLDDPLELIKAEARKAEPGANSFLVGLNGHLNYSAGFLLDRFDEPPVFGLPYTAPWYPDYFRGLETQRMSSWRFPHQPFWQYCQRQESVLRASGCTIRKLDKSRLKEELELYTKLNNASFKEHPFWAPRSPEEDWELFYPFRHLLRGDYLLFAEVGGKPVGFLLWYPDFNELVKGSRPLGLVELLRHKLRDPITSYRFTQIAVLPQFRNSHVLSALICQGAELVHKAGYQTGEGGFIFEANLPSQNMTQRLIERATGAKMQPYRHYGIFEGKLWS